MRVEELKLERFKTVGISSHPLADLCIPEDATCRICWASNGDVNEEGMTILHYVHRELSDCDVLGEPDVLPVYCRKPLDFPL